MTDRAWRGFWLGLFVGLLLVTVVGCGINGAGATLIPPRRWVDREAGVVCWMDGGISCLPLSATRLETR